MGDLNQISALLVRNAPVTCRYRCDPGVALHDPIPDRLLFRRADRGGYQLPEQGFVGFVDRLGVVASVEEPQSRDQRVVRHPQRVTELSKEPQTRLFAALRVDETSPAPADPLRELFQGHALMQSQRLEPLVHRPVVGRFGKGFTRGIHAVAVSPRFG
ncbi:hypothetical protein ACWEPH_18480 [Nocardia beijingensis]